MSWYRKYRPQKISDLALDSVRQVFSGMLDSGKFPQVMLFAGPRGTGKTSSARIIASILNDPRNEAVIDFNYFAGKKPKASKLLEPDDSDQLKRISSGESFVVSELDAASNRGIDDIRALKERLHLPPQGAKMAVYILDEVHMLTTEAFNALLKVLEETPNHVVFILATTEIEKIPATVISRCSVINFHKASEESIAQVLENISKNEKLEVDAEVLKLIAGSVDGSFRDAIKQMELLVNAGESLSLDSAKKILSIVSKDTIEALLASLLEKDEAQIIEIFKNLRGTNADEKMFFKNLLGYLHQNLLNSITGDAEAVLPQQVSQFLLKELTKEKLNFDLPIKFLSLEIIFLELINRSKSQNGGVKTTSGERNQTSNPKSKILNPKLDSKILNSKFDSGFEIQDSGLKISDENVDELKSDNLRQVTKGDGAKLLSVWDSFVQAVEKKQATIAMLLRSSKPIKASNGSLSVEVFYPFHKEKLEASSTISLLNECIEPLAGGNVALEFSVARQRVEQKPDIIENKVTDEEIELVDLASTTLL